MTMTHESTNWIKVAVEATNEFARQALGSEENEVSTDIQFTEELSSQLLSGSSLVLTCNGFLMEIGIVRIWLLIKHPLFDKINFLNKSVHLFDQQKQPISRVIAWNFSVNNCINLLSQKRQKAMFKNIYPG